MILVTVGTQKFPFNRLIKEIDKLVGQGMVDDQIIAQIGFSEYKPLNYKTYNLIDTKSMENYINQAELIITHAGTSSIILALKQRKKVIVVPRRKMYSEHVDDHQLEIARMFYELGFIEIVEDINELLNKIEMVKKKSYKEYTTEKSELLDSIGLFLKQTKIV